MRSGLAAALLAAAGYALLETAFVAERNLLLPWKARHVSLIALFFVIHGAVALGAWGAARAAARRLPVLGDALPVFAPGAVLLAIHVVTVQRERAGVLPRNAPGTLLTLGIVAALALAAVLAARSFRGKTESAGRAGALLGAALIVWGGVRMAAASAPHAEPVAAPRPVTDTLRAEPTGERVFLLGIDGATWDVLDPMMAAGRLPNLAALAARGRTFDVETIHPTFSPVIWTTVATGKDRFQHGIHDVVQTILPGAVRLPRSILRTAFLTKTTGVLFRALNSRHLVPRAPYRSSDVRAASVFEAASEAGLSTSLVEWYVTWPAVPLSGVTVSDRFHLQGPDAPGLTDVVHPAALAAALRHHVVPPGDVPDRLVSGLLDPAGGSPEEADAWSKRHARLLGELRLNFARDLTTRNVAVDLLSRDREWDLFVVYFRAVDLSHHLTWKYHRAARGGPVVEGEDADRLRDVVERYYEFVDGVAGEVLARVPPEATVIVLSDHGFEDVYDHIRGPDGFAILAGGVTAASPERGRISVYDVAPTVARILGLPPADDLRNGPRTDLLSARVTVVPAPASVPTWSRADRFAHAAEEAPDGVDRAEIERLRALGYVQ